MFEPESYGYGNQGGFGQYLLNQAMGQGGQQSAAEQQLKMGLEQAQRQAQSLMATQRGASPAMAMRRGLQAQTALSGQTQEQAAMMRAQEEERARQYWLQMEQMKGQQVMGNNQIQSQQSMLQAQMDAALRDKLIGGAMGAAGGIGGMLL